jgi:hypothetical protein
VMTLQRLEAVRQQEQLTAQQAATAADKLQQGITLYNEKKYVEAIPVLQEAFTLNPSSNDAANYLKLAQQEEQRLVAAAAVPKTPVKPREKVPVKTAVVKPEIVAATGPARLTTAFKSPFKDGYIMVKVGADVVAHENLFEQGKGIFKRRSGRAISVSKEFPAKNADVEVWVVVPSLSVQEHRSIRQSFAPGSNYTLTVSYDANSKAFDYRLE